MDTRSQEPNWTPTFPPPGDDLAKMPGESPAFAKLSGRTAVVTGASRGIGREIAREFARAGAAVIVHARGDREGADQTAGQLRAMGVEAVSLLADISDDAARQRLVAEAWSWRGGVDIWVNNAGADVLTGEPASWSFDVKLRRLWSVDVCGTIYLSREVGRRMREAQVGASQTANAGPSARARHENHLKSPSGNATPVILNVGWDQAEIGMEGDSGEMFATTKGAIMAFTRSLAKSLAPTVRVNCLAPGWIQTAWGEHASDYWQQRATREALVQRWGQPADVAKMARFLASEEAAFITGQTVAVNGGYRG